MKCIDQEFKVAYCYPVIFSKEMFRPDNDSLRDFLNQTVEPGEIRRALFVLDEGMLQHHPGLKEQIKHYFQVNTAVQLVPFITLPGGEQVKNTTRFYEEIISAINEYKIDRHSFVIAVGGGAVLDLAGYAAATAHRSIRHIRIPTTVLSQNDSGVGVKNGINYFGKKNFLGTFAPPFAVFNDAHFLIALDDRQWRSGIAEAVKVALIKDAVFFDWLEENAVKLEQRDAEAMDYLVYRCAELHLDHISSGDPFESGSSRPLDFGHWSAHKLEQLSDFSVTHGEAVAIGMALDCVYAEQIGWLDAKDKERILQVLGKLGFELYHPLLEKEELLNGLSEFREHLGGRLTIMQLKAIGKGENIHEISVAKMKESILYLKNKIIPAGAL